MLKNILGLVPPVVLYRMLTTRHEPARLVESDYPELAGVAAQFAFCDATDLWNER